MYHDKEHPKKSENRKNGFLKRNVSVNILSLQLFLSFVKVFSYFLKIFNEKDKIDNLSLKVIMNIITILIIKRWRPW